MSQVQDRPLPSLAKSRPVPDGHSTSSYEGSRVLPSKEPSADRFEDDYVQFILYCNPSIPLDSDTTELRRTFKSMPKTDGKTFDIFNLFELIRKLEIKEIDTWQQLVIDMGVAPPDVSSGQSTQKVQQYAVRLKRWLRASHIDAYFQYCLDKPNPYYTDIPSPSRSSTLATREGVSFEEDLALRALVPELRPKRGRKPNDEGLPSPGVKRPLRAAPWIEQTPVSALLQSASPWDRNATPRDLWTTARRSGGLYRLDHHENHDHQISQGTLPFDRGDLSFDMDLEGHRDISQSAVSARVPVSAFPLSGPQSAHPASSRSRKRHGPSVSAAWSSNTTSPGKIRGRPPANRSIQEGLFTTFPAHQNPLSSSADPAAELPVISQQASALAAIAGRTPPSQPRKPSKLQLQVPQHLGGPVRLATPPPKVLLNGSDSATGQTQEKKSSAEILNIDVEPSEMGESEDDMYGELQEIDWRRRAINLQKKVKELETELRNIKKRVLEAVM